jgi:hypothetical protein
MKGRRGDSMPKLDLSGGHSKCGPAIHSSDVEGVAPSLAFRPDG